MKKESKRKIGWSLALIGLVIIFLPHLASLVDYNINLNLPSHPITMIISTVIVAIGIYLID